VLGQHLEQLVLDAARHVHAVHADQAVTSHPHPDVEEAGDDLFHRDVGGEVEIESKT